MKKTKSESLISFSFYPFSPVDFILMILYLYVVRVSLHVCNSALRSIVDVLLAFFVSSVIHILSYFLMLVSGRLS